MRYWKLKDGKLVEGGKLEYWGFKLQDLKDKRDRLSDEYYYSKVSEYLEKIKQEMGV